MSDITLNIDGEGSTPKFRLLAEAVKNAISEGKLHTGESLPSVSLICEQFNLSRDTVFKAYSLLREQGVVMSHPGKGYYIADHITKVFVFLDTFKAYKEVLYGSFFRIPPSRGVFLPTKPFFLLPTVSAGTEFFSRSAFVLLTV